MYIVSQQNTQKQFWRERKGRWGGEANVDAVSSVSQPLCQLFNLWLKLKSLALAPELTSLKQKKLCSAQGATLIPCLEPYVWGRVRPFLGNTCIQYKSTASTNKLLPWALPPSCLLQDRFCFTWVLNFKWYTTKSAWVVYSVNCFGEPVFFSPFSCFCLEYKFVWFEWNC
jgi:hypothetical protein